jgi:hypothetical protein
LEAGLSNGRETSSQTGSQEIHVTPLSTREELSERMPEEEHTEQGNPRDDHAEHEHPLDSKLTKLLDRLDAYWPDLIHQGSIQRKFDRSPTPTYVLQFRQYHSGTQDARTKRLYLGKSRVLAYAVMNEVRRRREEAGTRHRPKKRRWSGPADQTAPAEFLEKLKRKDPSVVFSPGFAGWEGLLKLQEPPLKGKEQKPSRERR